MELVIGYFIGTVITTICWIIAIKKYIKNG